LIVRIADSPLKAMFKDATRIGQQLSGLIKHGVTYVRRDLSDGTGRTFIIDRP
jgi:hypothetical protein